MMPRKKTLWFRFYVEAIHDRKLRRQPPSHRWLWVVVLALARKSPVPGTLLLTVEGGGEDEVLEIADLVDEAALPRKDVTKGMSEFERLGMLDRDDDGAWVVVKWGERQFESDDVTKRTSKHRSKEHRRNVPTNGDSPPDGTPPSHARATEAEAEADQEEGASDSTTWELLTSRRWSDLAGFGGTDRLRQALADVEAAGWQPTRAVNALLAGNLDRVDSVGAVLVSRAEQLAKAPPEPPVPAGHGCPDCDGAGIWWSDLDQAAVQCAHPRARTSA